MSQPPPHLPLLDLRPGKLLLLLRLEFHVRVVFPTRVCRRRRSARDVAAHVAAAGAGVLEPVERDSEMAFVRHAAVGDVPLLGAESADEFFVVRDPAFRLVLLVWEIDGACLHHDTAFVIPNRDRQSTQRIAIQEVRRLVKHEQMRIIPHRARQNHFHLLPTTET